MQRVFIAALMVSAALSSADTRTIHTYHGHDITIQTVAALAPQLNAHDKEYIERWLTLHASIIIKIATLPLYGSKEERAHRYKLIKNGLKAHGLHNQGNSNYAFKIKIPSVNRPYIVKIASPNNRKENLNALLKQPYGSVITKEQYLHLKAIGQDKTYQIISRIAHYLRFCEWKEYWKTTHKEEPPIDAADAYLMHIPGQPYDIADGNYVIIEKYIEEAYPLYTNSPLLLKAKPALKSAIRYIGMWDIKDHNFLIDVHGRIICVDLEQPNNSKPSEFFHRDVKKYEWNVHVGLKELDELCEELQKEL